MQAAPAIVFESGALAWGSVSSFGQAPITTIFSIEVINNTLTRKAVGSKWVPKI